MKRKSGILLHISSLPGKEGIGTIGQEAKNFIDFLIASGQSYWQVLPLSPAGYGNSPYSSVSAYAGNPLFIDLDFLSEQIGEKIKFKTVASTNKVDYGYVTSFKLPLLKQAAIKFLEKGEIEDYKLFKAENKFWLSNFAEYSVIKEQHENKPLWDFSEGLRLRKPEELKKFRRKNKQEIEIKKAIQYFFFTQWNELRKYANQKGIEIIGDIPLYVAADSSDIWAYSENFMLDENLTPAKVAGVPPDYFSETGQLWGNPLYDWERMKTLNYKWWIERLNLNFKLYDVVRIDHFRGLAEFWAVPFGNETAVEGSWMPAGSKTFFDYILKKTISDKFIAEDLGFITKDVVELRKRYNFPGMKILQFAFNAGNTNPFLPYSIDDNSIAYTGTHDNDTTLGWFKSAEEEEKEYFEEYLNKKVTSKNVCDELIRLTWATVAETAIVPLQDLLNLDTDARMNFPGTIEGNWEWRSLKKHFNQKVIDYLLNLNETYYRNIKKTD